MFTPVGLDEGLRTRWFYGNQELRQKDMAAIGHWFLTVGFWAKNWNTPGHREVLREHKMDDLIAIHDAFLVLFGEQPCTKA